MIHLFGNTGHTVFVNRTVAFTVKNIGTKILFACWLDSSTVEIAKRIKAWTFKYGLSCVKNSVRMCQCSNAWASVALPSKCKGSHARIYMQGYT